MSDQKNTVANVNEEDDFTSTKGSGNTWDPKQNEEKIPYAQENYPYDATAQANHKEKDVLIGYFVDRRDDIGKHKSSVITIQTKDGEKKDVWLDTVLKQEIEKVPSMNILVRIEWTGTKLKDKMKAGQKGATYNTWNVGYKESDVLAGKEAVTNVAETASSPSDNATTPTPTDKVMNTGAAANDNDDLPF